MENENILQPIDVLMTKLGIASAELVKASTEQLSFKMVQKARKGRYLSLSVQEKILNALLKVRPELKIRRRELFHYPLDPSVVEKISEAIHLIQTNKVDHPGFIDLLVEAGINHYAVDVAADKVIFYGSGGEAHTLEVPAISQAAAGTRHSTGVISYEVNLRQRKITYKGESESFREDIPPAGVKPEIVEAKPAEIPVIKKPASRKKKKQGLASKTRKARLTVRKQFFKKKKR